MGTTLENVLEDLDALDEHISYFLVCQVASEEDKKTWKDRVNLLRGHLLDSFSKDAQ